MSGGVFLIGDDGTLTEMKEMPYLKEDHLQSLLAEHPALLGGDQVSKDSPRRWLLVQREAPLPSEDGGSGRWSVDHLFLDQEAVPTLVEVKRSSDTRIRREVVGQMLDYAANAVLYWPLQQIQAQFEATCEARGQDPEEVLGDFLQGGDEPNAFWTQVKTNLQAGRVRLLFVADVVPEKLRRVVEFLNGQMDPAEVLAVEIKQYVGGNLKTLVPRVVGHTAAATQKKATGRSFREWDEGTFIEELIRNRGDQETAVAKGLLTWSRARALDVHWGQGVTRGSFVPTLVLNERDHQLFIVLTTGQVEMLISWHRGKSPPFNTEEGRREWIARLNETLGLSLPPEAIHGQPKIDMAHLAKDDGLQRFLKVMDWVIEQIKSHRCAQSGSV